MSATVVDEKNRVVLNLETRKAAGLKKGDRLSVIPFRGGVILVNVRGKKFARSLMGFSYKEEKHEASRFLFKKTH